MRVRNYERAVHELIFQFVYGFFDDRLLTKSNHRSSIMIGKTKKTIINILREGRKIGASCSRYRSLSYRSKKRSL